MNISNETAAILKREVKRNPSTQLHENLSRRHTVTPKKTTTRPLFWKDREIKKTLNERVRLSACVPSTFNPNFMTMGYVVRP